MSERTKPLIGLNADRANPDDPNSHWGVRQAYVDCITRAGGVPMIVPPLTDREDLGALLVDLDGFLLTGGDDLGGELWGEPTLADKITPLDERRGTCDFLLVDLLLNRGIPVLAVCLGFQEINVHLGGSLYQDLATDGPKTGTLLEHGSHRGEARYHTIDVAANSRLERILGPGEHTVNSKHHQAIRELGRGLRATAIASDGIIEAWEHEDHPFCVGVQWHPEIMTDQELGLAIFREFVRVAEKE